MRLDGAKRRLPERRQSQFLENVVNIGVDAFTNICTHESIGSGARLCSAHGASRNLTSCLWIYSKIQTWHRCLNGITSVFAINTLDWVDTGGVSAFGHSGYFATNFDPKARFGKITDIASTAENGVRVSNQMLVLSLGFDLAEVELQSFDSYSQDGGPFLFRILGCSSNCLRKSLYPRYINVLTFLKDVRVLLDDSVLLEVEHRPNPLKVEKALLFSPATPSTDYPGPTLIGSIASQMRNGRKLGCLTISSEVLTCLPT
jgi:hypothetical protein